MKKVKGIITIQYEKRIVDRIAAWAYKRNLYEIDGYYPITKDATREEIGGFVCIKGALPIVRVLEVITEVRGKDTKEVTVEY